MKICSPDKLILGHVNINSTRNKLDSLVYMQDRNIDFFFISETKLDDSFPLTQFKIEGFTTPYRYNRNDKGGGHLRILWRIFYHVYCNVNRNATQKIFPLRSN